MAQTNFKIDTIIVDGVSYAIEDGTATLSGSAGFEQSAILSGTGPDFVSRKRVPRMVKCKLQFGMDVTPPQLENMQGVQISARDTLTGRRALLNDCVFSSMGDVGAGQAVDVTFVVLQPVQWL